LEPLTGHLAVVFDKLWPKIDTFGQIQIFRFTYQPLTLTMQIFSHNLPTTNAGWPIKVCEVADYRLVYSRKNK